MIKNRNAIVVFTIFLVFILLTNHIGAEGNESKLSRLAEGMEHQGIQIDEWSLYSKKNVDKKTINDVKHMTDLYRHYNWTYEQANDVYKAVGVYKNKDKNITEKLQILTTLTNKHSQSYILYEVKGEGMQSDWNNVNEYFRGQAFDIFREDPTIYACIKGSYDDMMKVVLKQKANDVLKEFSADPVEQLQEQGFLSVSAKTSLWEDLIPTNNDEMNIQIAMRSDGLGGKTTVVIGTPIITSEY